MELPELAGTAGVAEPEAAWDGTTVGRPDPNAGRVAPADGTRPRDRRRHRRYLIEEKIGAETRK